MVRIGAVDIGTNSVRLLVADVDDKERLKTAHRWARSVASARDSTAPA